MKKKYIGKDGKLKFQGNKPKNGQVIECTDQEWDCLYLNQCYFKDIEVKEIKVKKKSKSGGKK